MSYITEADLLKVISQAELDEIMEGEAPVLLTDALAIAESTMVTYLARFDLTQGLALSGNSRDALLVVRLCDIALYHLYTRISPRNIPDLRETRYKEAMRYLEAVNKATLETPFRVKTDTNQQATYLKWGSRSVANGFDFFDC